MDTFNHLMTAQTGAEFFVILSSLLNSNIMSNVRATVTSTREGEVFVLQLSIEQTLRYGQPNERWTLHAEMTHRFILSQHGQLTWWMKDQPTLTGLAPIQAALKERLSWLADQPLVDHQV